MKELIYGLQQSCNLSVRIPKGSLSHLLALDESTIPNEGALLAYIEKRRPRLLLSKTYARKKAGEERQMREITRRGEFAPTIQIRNLPFRDPSEPDASLAQKRFLRDLGVRDEALLAAWGGLAKKRPGLRRLVEPRGFEPLTPTMPLWCSTN